MTSTSNYYRVTKLTHVLMSFSAILWANEQDSRPIICFLLTSDSVPATRADLFTESA